MRVRIFRPRPDFQPSLVVGPGWIRTRHHTAYARAIPGPCLVQSGDARRISTVHGELLCRTRRPHHTTHQHQLGDARRGVQADVAGQCSFAHYRNQRSINKLTREAPVRPDGDVDNELDVSAGQCAAGRRRETGALGPCLALLHNLGDRESKVTGGCIDRVARARARALKPGRAIWRLRSTRRAGEGSSGAGARRAVLSKKWGGSVHDRRRHEAGYDTRKGSGGMIAKNERKWVGG